jgi:hypothetical protein
MARLSRSGLGLRRSLSPKATLSLTVMCGNSEYAWKTMPMSRLLAGRWVTSCPPTITRPVSASSSPASSRRVVVFPQPEGPSSTTSSPGCSVRSSPSSALTSP